MARTFDVAPKVNLQDVARPLPGVLVSPAASAPGGSGPSGPSPKAGSVYNVTGTALVDPKDPKAVNS